MEAFVDAVHYVAGGKSTMQGEVVALAVQDHTGTTTTHMEILDADIKIGSSTKAQEKGFVNLGSVQEH